MVSAAPSRQATEHVAFSRLLWVGPLAIVAAIAAIVVIRLIAVAALQPDPRFGPLTPSVPITFTFIGVLGAVIVFAIVGRFARRPIRLFRRIALAVLLISFVPDILLLVIGAMPGTTLPNVLTLVLMHVVAWAITVRLLTTLARG